MGGFHLFQRPPLATGRGDNPREDEIPICPLYYIPEGAVIPTENEIKDRGKSDLLAKVIVLVQTSWFVTQCIARGIKHLQITELEIVTLAYIMMNFVTYMFWWRKPRNVGYPIRVYMESGSRERPYEDLPTGKLTVMLKKIIPNLAGGEDIAQLNGAHDLPRPWSGQHEHTKDDLLVIIISGLGPAIAGIGFGATHFIAWPYEFPSYSELILWRISCITMAAVPGIAILAIFVWMAATRYERVGPVLKSFILSGIVILVFASLLGGWLYYFARMATIIVAFTTLRSLPSDAFKVVDWTTFIPHI